MTEWQKEVTHITSDGEPMTVKRSVDGRHALIARGHLSDIRQGGADHVHLWDLGTGDFRLHDMRVSRRLVPNVRDDEADRRQVGLEAQQARDARHRDFVDRARRLLASGVDGKTVAAAKELDREWRASGRPAPENLHAFRGVIDEIFATNRERVEKLKSTWATNKSAKERLVSQAESLASFSDLKAAGDKMRSLSDEWRTIGPCEKADNDRLWARFNAARTKLSDARTREFEKRKREWADNKSAKERLVSQAESLASSSDLKAAGDRMRSLGDEWRKIGPCEKADNDRLWAKFNAARTKLNDRKKREFDERRTAFEKRKAEWSRNKAAKEALVSRAESLSGSSDLRAAGDGMRALSDQWKATGPCEKTDNDRLWARFNAARARLNDRRTREFEERKAERKRKAYEYVSRLEQQLSNVDAAIYRAQESYSRALSARSPSMRNPNWHQIANNQLARQSSARERLSSLQSRRADILSKIMQARSQASSL